MDRLKEETLTVVMTFEKEVFNQYVGYLITNYVVVKTHSEVNQKMALGRKFKFSELGVKVISILTCYTTNCKRWLSEGKGRLKGDAGDSVR